MQVAQLLGEALDYDPPQPPEIENMERMTSSLEPGTPRSRASFTQMQAEKRKSSYEKYSAIILPPLKEEATPAPTPEGTLNRTSTTSTDTPTDAMSIASKQVTKVLRNVKADFTTASTSMKDSLARSQYVDVHS